MLVYCLLSLSLAVLFCQEPAIGQRVFLEHNGHILPNFGLLEHSDIGTSRNFGDVGSNLVCRTDNTSCCRDADNPNGPGFGNWYYPNGGVVVFGYQVLPSRQIYRLRRDTQVVRLQRDGTASTYANGIYCCEVTDQNGTNEVRYVGLYTDGAGNMTLSEDLKLSLISLSPLEFALTCTTTGGPPTFIEWTDLTRMVPLPSEQVSVKLLDQASSAFQHIARFLGMFPRGTYELRTRNVRMRNPVVTFITIINTVSEPPMYLTAVQNDVSSILVSWAAPISGPNVTCYHIFFTANEGSNGSVNVGADATSHNLTHLAIGNSYNVSIVSLGPLPSDAVGPVTVLLERFEAPNVTTEVLSPTSIRVTFTQPSDSLAAERYNIQYTRVTGANQSLCSGFTDTNGTADVQSPFTIVSLQEYSAYDITVTAYALSATRTKNEQAMTPSAAPAGPPSNLMNSTFHHTAITVVWNRVRCIERNGVIEDYIVQFGSEDKVQNDSTIWLESGSESRIYTASGLTPLTNYSFQVAAVNSAGRGPFSAPLVVMTSGISPNPPTSLASPYQSSTSITLAWEQPAGDVVDRYDITYTYLGECPNYTQPENMATVNRSTIEYTLQGLQEFSNYSITVTAVNTWGMNESNITTVSTMEAVPLSSPQMLTSTSQTSNAITVSWVGVECIEQNGEIENYEINIGIAEYSTQIQGHTLPSNQQLYTVIGLIPFTNYSIEVAAVNSVGRGPFSAPLTVQTAEDVPGLVDSVAIFVDIASITLAWNKPMVPNGIIQRYEIEYCDEDSNNTMTVNHGAKDPENKVFSNRQTSKVLVGLKPDTTYNINIQAYNTHAGNVTSVSAKTLSIPRVSCVEVRAVNTTAVVVSWVAVDIAPTPGIQYKLNYHTSSSHYTEDSILAVSGGQTSAVVHVELLAVAGLEHHFSVAAAYEVDGELFEGEYSDITVFHYDEAYFQLWLTPVDNCATWNPSRIASMRSWLHTAVAKVISKQCSCNFPVEHIKEGEFRCWSSATEVIYRGSITATRTHTAEELVGHLNEWVKSDQPVLKMNGVALKAFSSCPLNISADSYDLECPEDVTISK